MLRARVRTRILIVLGGGIGRAPGFAESVTVELDRIAPVMPAIRVSALGTDAVTDGCLAAGCELAWGQVMTALPTAPSGSLPGLYLPSSSHTWLKNQVGCVIPEQVPAPLVPGQPPLPLHHVRHQARGRQPASAPEPQRR